MAHQSDSQGPLWEVFIQAKTGQPYRHAGSLHAFDKEMALDGARDLYCRRGEATGMWVVRADHIIAVPVEDAAPFFDPADDKVYRHPTFYDIPADVKNM